MSGATSVVKAPSAHTGSASASLAVNGGKPVSATQVPFMSVGLSEADIAAATAVLKSGMLRAAKKCAELETRFAGMTDAKHGLTCANGTCALQLAYGALVKPGDHVLVPAWTYIATVSMVVAAGCTPVFCDALPETYQIDVRDAEKRITPKTTAIACTHLYGMPVDIGAVEDLAKRKGLRVIYDAAQSHLATYDSGKGAKGIGAFGDAVTYSFYATKNLGTGEGGLVTTNDEKVKRQMELLRSHGETDKYLHEQVGFNYRMNDITGAIGCSKLDRLQGETDQRRQNASRYDAMIADVAGLKAPGRTKGADGVWHLYTVQMDPAKFTCTRDEFCKALGAEGVPTATHYPRSVTRQPAFKDVVRDHPPVADGLASRVFCLPMHHNLTDEHFRVVGEAVGKVARAFRK